MDRSAEGMADSKFEEDFQDQEHPKIEDQNLDVEDNLYEPINKHQTQVPVPLTQI